MLSTESPHTLHTNGTSLSLTFAYFCQIPPVAVLQHPALPFTSQPCLLTGSQPLPYYDSAVCPKPPCSGMSPSLPFTPRSPSPAFHFGGFIDTLPYTIQWLPGEHGSFSLLGCCAVMALGPGISNLKEISTELLYALKEHFPQNHHQVW